MDPFAVFISAFAFHGPELIGHGKIVNISNAQVGKPVYVQERDGRGKERYSALRVIAPIYGIHENTLPAASELFDPCLLGDECKRLAACVDLFEGHNDDVLGPLVAGKRLIPSRSAAARGAPASHTDA